MPQIKLKLDVCTRWNSIYEMINRLIENRCALLNLALTDKEVSNLILNKEEWDILINIRQILSHFKDITDLLCSSRFPSISILKPIIKNISENKLQNKENDTTQIISIKDSIRKDFKVRIEEYKDIQDLLTLSCLLDPRMKNIYLTSYNERCLRRPSFYKKL